MSELEKQLHQDLQAIANSLQERRLKLAAEQEETNSKAARLQAHLDQIDASAKLAREYPVSTGRTVFCPRCWINDQGQVSLRDVAGTKHVNRMRCDKCNYTIEAPV